MQATRVSCLLLIAAVWCSAGCGSNGNANQNKDQEPTVEPAPSEPKQPAKEPGQPAAAKGAAKSGNSLWTRKRGDDWPRFLGVGVDSTSSEKGLPLGDVDPRIVWQKKLGISYGAGVVSEGRFYQFDRFGDDARLSCLNAETGEELWKHEYPTTYEDLYGYNGGPRCSPLVDGDRVYTLGAEGVLQCLNAYTGEPIWKVDTEKEFGVIQNFFGVGSNPVISGDLLIVMVGGSPEADKALPPGQLDRVSGDGSGIVAFDKKTGKVKYRLSDELASYASLITASVKGREWCFAFARGGLLAFEPKTGKLDFHYPWRARSLESVNASVPVVVGDQVLISETYGPGSSLLRVSPGKYEVVWSDDPNKREKSLQTHWNTPVYVNKYVYGCSGRHPYNAELRCVEWATGKVQWSEPGLTRTSLTYVDGHFLCLGEDGTLRLLKVDPRKYNEVRVIKLRDENNLPLLKEPCWAAPIVTRGLLYVRGENRLLCLDLIPQSGE